MYIMYVFKKRKRKLYFLRYIVDDNPPSCVCLFKKRKRKITFPCNLSLLMLIEELKSKTRIFCIQSKNQGETRKTMFLCERNKTSI